MFLLLTVQINTGFVISRIQKLEYQNKGLASLPVQNLVRNIKILHPYSNKPQYSSRKQTKICNPPRQVLVLRLANTCTLENRFLKYTHFYVHSLRLDIPDNGSAFIYD